MAIKPGSRSGKYGSKGLMNSPATFLHMLYCATVKVTAHIKPGKDTEPGPDIILAIAQMGRVGKIEINLSDMTTAELSTFRECIDAAIDWAEPVVASRDEDANAKFDAGDDSFERIYRAVPAVVYRKRISGEHREGIYTGSAHVSTGDGADGSPDGAGGGSGASVAEHDETEGRTQDHPVPPSQPPVLRPLGEAP